MDTMKFSLWILGLVFCTNVGYVRGRADGAPRSACVSLMPGRSGHPQTPASDSSNPYFIDIFRHGVTYTPGVPVQVRVWSRGSFFRGILLQARKTDGTGSERTRPRGRFIATPENFKIVQCSAFNDSVTHMNTASKPDPSTFTWMPPDNDVGEIQFIATIAREQWQWWGNNTGPRITFQAPDPCASSPCRNGGTCSRSGSTFRCSCLRGWAGRQCEISVPGPPSIPPPPPSSGQQGRGPVDCLFMLDTSDGAVNIGGTQPMQNFMRGITDGLCSQSYVAAITYGNNAVFDIPWRSADSSAASALANLQISRKSSTNTNLALDLARNEAFSPNQRQGRGDPSQNPNWGILITEGPAPGGKASSYQNACEQLFNQRRIERLYIIGITTGSASADSFRNICPQNRQSPTVVNVNTINNFNALGGQVQRILRDMNSCGGGTPDPCSPNPCRNQGRCIRNQNTFRCECTGSWTGRICEQRQDACSNRPCRNGGTCVPSGSQQYRCNCPFGWTGRNCDQRSQPTNACNSFPCRNGGTCISSGNFYQCRCTSGWAGTNCDQRSQDPCSPNPCRNNGQCSRNGGSYQCFCRGGFTGRNCEGADNVCTLSDCENGGTCRSLPTSKFCQCPPGFSGNRCQIRGGTGVTPNEVFLARFEDDRNLLQQENGGKDRFDWRVSSQNGKPPFGPRLDASEYSSRGGYAYISPESNRNYLGENARYIMPATQETGAFCLEFRYFMNGARDIIRVLVQRSNGQVVGVAEITGNAGSTNWRLAQVGLEEQRSNFRVIFEAIPFSDYSSGRNIIAIDFIQLLSGGFCDPREEIEGPFFRIVGGPSLFEGRVEVSRRNSTNPNDWAGLCRDGFGTLEAQMLCAALFPGSEQVLGFRAGRTISLPWESYGQPMTGYMGLDGIDCTDADSLSECKTSGWRETQCLVTESAAVRCDQPEFYYVGEEMRLENFVLDEAAGTFSGLLQLLYTVGGTTQWGTVCSNGFSQNEAQAVCNTIGFRGQASVNPNMGGGQATGPVFGNIRCPSNGASDITQCFTAQTFANTNTCPHFQDVGVTCRFLTRNVPFNCGFENTNSVNGPNCGFYAASMNTFEWMVGSPPVGSAKTGRNVMYARLQPTGGSSNNMLDGSSSLWISPIIEAFPTTDFLCLRFSYNAYDIRNFQRPETPFAVYLKMGRENKLIFWLDPDIGTDRTWTDFATTLKGTEISAPIKFALKAINSLRGTGYIMVDDISVTQGSCTAGAGYINRPGGGGGGPPPVMPPGVTPAPPPTTGSCPNNVNTPSNLLFTCDFNRNLCPNYLTMGGQSSTTELNDWVLASDSTPSAQTGPSDSFNTPGFIFLEASSVPTGSYGVARVSQPLQGNLDYCLSFDYHMNGENIGSLGIALSNQNSISRVDRGNSHVFEVSGRRGMQWQSEQVDLRIRGGRLSQRNLFLVAVRGNGYQGDVSLDNVRLRAQECCPAICASNLRGTNNANIYNCNFEENFEGCCFRNCPDRAPMDNSNQAYRRFCGNVQGNSPGRMQWLRFRANSSPAGGSGRNYPQGSGSGSNYYLGVTERTNDGGRSGSATGRLFTGDIDMDRNSVYLRMRTHFWTRSGSGSGGRLQVGVIGTGNRDVEIRTITRGSDSRSSWQTDCVEIRRDRAGQDNRVNVYVDGDPSSSQDIFIDDVSLSTNRC